MNRPMPGPPECSPVGFPHDHTAREACLIHARSYHANSKRLKDNECEAELEAASESASTCHLLAALGDKRMTPWQLQRQMNAEDTWLRFLANRHVLEEA